MWSYNYDTKKWSRDAHKTTTYDFNLLKKDAKDIIFYSSAFNAAVYAPVNNVDNLYDILKYKNQYEWYADGTDENDIPKESPNMTNKDYYEKYLPEYNFTLKTLFSPNRLMYDSLKNYTYVDLATTDELDIESVDETSIIDDEHLRKGMRILVKDNKSKQILNDYDVFTLECNYTSTKNEDGTITYEYYDETNGVYLFDGEKLVKTNDFDNYSDCIRYSVFVKNGNYNKERQYHLNRIEESGYYPVGDMPKEFIERHNYLIRNKTMYNNLFEINYYDIITDGDTNIAVGEYGVIMLYYDGTTNILNNQYKYTLRSITKTNSYYWICGDNSTLLKVDKINFTINKVKLPLDIPIQLNSISFLNDNYGFIVGQFNTILYTEDGGNTWKRFYIEAFREYDYNRVYYYSMDNIFIVGDNGVFLVIKYINNEMLAFKKDITRNLYPNLDVNMFDHINDLCIVKFNNGTIKRQVLNNYTNDEKDITFNGDYLLMCTDNNNIILYDFNDNCELNSDSIFVIKIVSSLTNVNTQNIRENIKNYGDIITITTDDNNIIFSCLDDLGNTYIKNITISSIFNNIQSNSKIGLYDDFEIEIQYNNVILIDSGIVLNTYGNSFYCNRLLLDGNYMYYCGNDSNLKRENIITKNPLDIINYSAEIDKRLKSKMLVLDYDIANKANFFNDEGDYRLPYLDEDIITNDSLYSFHNPCLDITNSDVTSSDDTTVSYQPVWLDYYQDSFKTFPYGIGINDTPMSDITAVIFSTDFRLSDDNIITIGEDDICDDEDILEKFIPYDTKYITGKNKSLDDSDFPSTTFKLFMRYDIMVIYAPEWEVGDVIYFDSDVLKYKFIINNKLGDYCYVFTDFNDGIINSIKESENQIIIENLNEFVDIEELVSKFNRHYIGDGYKLTYNNELNIEALENSETVYFDMELNIRAEDNNKVYKMKYTEGFIKFGYTPKYSLLTYLQSIDKDIFDPKKKFLVMPSYKDIEISDDVIKNPYTVTYDYENELTARILFGKNLYDEWLSIFNYTFVNIDIDGDKTEELLIVDKYETKDFYVIEFDRSFTYYGLGKLFSISSRNTLQEISDDLAKFNNIQKPQLTRTFERYSYNGNNYQIKTTYDTSITSYEREISMKVPTDSYAKILLSDMSILAYISAMIYVDYKNELAMNIINTEKSSTLEIIDTYPKTDANGNKKLVVITKEKHNILQTGLGAFFRFDGDVDVPESSQSLNKEYQGYHIITNIVSPYSFEISVDYGVDITQYGIDHGYVDFITYDSLMNFEPVDIIDVGSTGEGKISVRLTEENILFEDNVYKLQNVDYTNYRYRLVDKLNTITLANKYKWFLSADVYDAVIGENEDGFVFYKGIWEFGRWYEGTWYSGTWLYGDWFGGKWYSKVVSPNALFCDVSIESNDNYQSVWFNGRFYDGKWNGGTWINGRFYGGEFNSGTWRYGIFNNGTWNGGDFKGGVWCDGTWNDGKFNCNLNPSYWLYGHWRGGDFENGLWYDGILDSSNKPSTFGTKATLTHNAKWESGKFLNADFYAGNTFDENANIKVNDNHIVSIFKTGYFMGNFYGGLAYNVNMVSSKWYGGIVEQARILSMKYYKQSSDGVGLLDVTLKGDYRYNIGDKVAIICDDFNYDKGDAKYGIHSAPSIHTVIKYSHVSNGVDTNTNMELINTVLTLDGTMDNSGYLEEEINTDKGYKLTSIFESVDWKTGIWMNGIFKDGKWRSGIWYNGYFDSTFNE